ncbi:MAG: glycosyltransferase [Bacteroidota bacterium]
MASIHKYGYRGGEYELLIIDNGSNDRTSQVIERWKNEFSNFKSIYCDKPGLHVGRNLGYLLSRGEYITYFDDDIEITKDWFVSIKECINNFQPDLIGGKVQPVYEGRLPFWIESMWGLGEGYPKMVPQLSVIDMGPEIIEVNPILVWGCNFTVNREVLNQTMGFNPDGMPKDLIRFRGDGETAISRAIQQNDEKAIYHPGLMVKHHIPNQRLTKDYFYWRSFIQGITDSYSQLRSAPQNNPNYKKDNNLNFLDRIKTIRNKINRNEKRIRKINRLTSIEHDLKVYREKGFAYHQAEYENDPELQKWVHKEHYLDIDYD